MPDHDAAHGSPAGFVYILVNPSLPGLVKIGLTSGSADDRAKQLSGGSGVPTSFEVAWDELVGDCAAVERRLHERFASYRVNERREFFRIPLRQAIAALQSEARLFSVDQSLESRENILHGLETRFRRWLRRDLVGAYIVHVAGVAYLELVFQPHAWIKDLEIKRFDLDFISGADDEPEFPPDVPAGVNARAFLDLDTYSLWYLFPMFNTEIEEHFKRLEADGQKHEFPRGV